MKMRWVWIAVAAAIVLAGGGFYYARTRAQAPPQGRDPAVGLLAGIRMLERDPATQLTKEQIAAVLPLIKALKDIPVSDTEQVRAVVRTVSEAFTPAQRAALDEMRRRIQAGRRPGGPAAGPGGGPGTGPGGGFGGAQGQGFDPQQARARLFEATIRMLEQRR
ncbi:MAG: hypothetical protein RDU83_10700 [bacterium]|nr:hypothetical protein [bacterium]